MNATSPTPANRWREAAKIGALLVIAAVVLRWCAQPSEYTVAHDAAANLVLDALAGYRKQHGRFPAHLRELQPAFLAAHPAIHPQVELFYAATDAGDNCWVAYTTQHTMMPSDTFKEYDCLRRALEIRDISEAKTARSGNVETFPPR